MWKKEGWTQENPVTAETFAETAMDFCSRHSFDKPPQAPRPPGGAGRPAKRPMHEMSEDEQLQAAMRASLQRGAIAGDGDDINNEDYEMEDDGDDDVEYLGSNAEGDAKPKATEEVKPKEPSLLDELLDMAVGDEPAKGARLQLKMPDGKRSVRKFDPSETVKAIYAFVAVSVPGFTVKQNTTFCALRLTKPFYFYSNQVKRQKEAKNSFSWRGSHQRIYWRILAIR
jgi:hypothetical protein